MPAPTSCTPSDFRQILKDRLFASEDDPLLDRLTRFVATVLRVPVVFMTLVDRERQHFHHPFCETGALKGKLGTPISQSFCRHVVESGEPLIVPDTRIHPVTQGNSVIDEHEVVAYAGVPLTHSSGYRLGTLCAIDYHPRAWTEQNVMILRSVAAQIITELELRLTSAELHQRLVELCGDEEERHRATRHTVHDLRTPLTSLLLCLQSLPAIGALSPEQEEYVAICTRATASLRRIVDSLLEVDLLANRGEAGFTVHPCQLSLLVRQALDQVVGVTAEKRICISTVVPDDLPALEAEPEALVRVLVNLLGNAAKFTPEGGSIEVRAVASDGEMRIVVSDSGIGISPQDTSRVLQNGTRVSCTVGTPSSSGLGLVFCRRVIRAHGGDIDVQSELGKGSAFTIRLPLKRPGPAG